RTVRRFVEPDRAPAMGCGACAGGCELSAGLGLWRGAEGCLAQVGGVAWRGVAWRRIGGGAGAGGVAGVCGGGGVRAGGAWAGVGGKRDGGGEAGGLSRAAQVAAGKLAEAAGVYPG